MKKNILIFSTLVFVLMGFRFLHQDPWVVPDKYNKMANPVKSDAAATATGKELWIKHCQSCHGKTGKGDGSKAAQLKTVPEDMTKAAIQKRQPMQRSLSISTIPSCLLKVASTGQTFTQGGSSQCMHVVGCQYFAE